MTKKLENASGNLKEILIAIADGKEVQFKNHKDSWRDYDTELIDNYMCLNLNFEWRIKPDAFEDAWEQYLNGRVGSDVGKDIFKAGFYKGIAHKEQEHE